MGNERMFSNCDLDHTGQVSCSRCGWVMLDDTVFVDVHYRPVELQASIFEGEELIDGKPVKTKMTFMWLEERKD